jgi:hypothetical protein
MRKAIVLLGSVCLTGLVIVTLSAPVSAQMAINTTWKCAAPKPNVVPVPDKADHAYIVEQVACTAAKGEVGGVKEKDGVATEFVEATGATSTGHGIFVATLASGDKVTYSYTLKGVSKNNMLDTGSNAWTMTGGTGKFKGISGKGTCAAKGNADGTAVFDCTGTYAIK